jgi:hypothetical protein
MKKKLLLLFALGLLLSCNETSSTVFSLKEDTFNKVMQDSMVINVESNGSQIEMKGNLNLLGGECKLILKVPNGDTIYSVDTTFINDTIYSIKSLRRINTIFNLDSIFKYDTIYAIDSVFIVDTIFTINKLPQYDTVYKRSFQAENSYTIDEKYDRIIGKWTFIYQMKKIDTTLPEGSFDFVIKYND